MSNVDHPLSRTRNFGVYVIVSLMVTKTGIITLRHALLEVLLYATKWQTSSPSHRVISGLELTRRTRSC